MKKNGKRNISIIACITVVVLIITAISIKTGNSAVSNVVGTVISPFQKGGAVVVNSVGNFFGNIFSSGKNAEENKKLKEENLELEAQIRMLEGYKTENEQLRAMIDLNDNRTEFKSVGANVIARDSSEFHSIITIDKGSKEGIKENAVVTVPEGLVGFVYEVGYNYSKVKTVYDSECSVSAICLRSGDMGIIEATAENALSGVCSMNYIDKSAKTVVGDMIETSGTGGVFPRGILIGKVTEIKEDGRNLTLSATVETSVNINNIDKVLVSK